MWKYQEGKWKLQTVLSGAFVTPFARRAPVLGWGGVMGAQLSKSWPIWIWQGILERPPATNSFYDTWYIIPANPTPTLTLCQLPALFRGRFLADSTWVVVCRLRWDETTSPGLPSPTHSLARVRNRCSSLWIPQALVPSLDACPRSPPAGHCAGLFLRRYLLFIWMWDEFGIHFNLNCHS